MGLGSSVRKCGQARACVCTRVRIYRANDVRAGELAHHISPGLGADPL